MKTTKRVEALRRLLDLCDDLRRIRHRMSDPDLRRDARARLRRESARKSESLARDFGAYRYRGPLGRMLRECKLNTEHFQVLATLLQAHLREDEPACQGRHILSAVFDTSFDVLSGVHLLHETSPLRTSGLVVLAFDEEEVSDDVLEASFRLSDDVLSTFRDEVHGGTPEDRRRPRRLEYGNNRDFLLDLRILHNLYQLRCERVFNSDRWNRVHNISRDPGHAVTQRIEAFWARLRTRLDATPGAAEFPVVRFMTEHGLEEEETVIVVHLLFRELYEGNAYTDAAELLKLVSASESDLIRNRRLFHKSGSLVSHEILELEPMLESREMTAEVHLADWAVNSVLGNSAAEREIQPDERLDWHFYLKNLEDTGAFYRDLDAN